MWRIISINMVVEAEGVFAIAQATTATTKNEKSVLENF